MILYIQMLKKKLQKQHTPIFERIFRGVVDQLQAKNTNELRIKTETDARQYGSEIQT